MTVEVGHENAVAQTVYRRTGFVKTDRQLRLFAWPIPRMCSSGCAPLCATMVAPGGMNCGLYIGGAE